MRQSQIKYGAITSLILCIIISTYLISGKNASTATSSKCLEMPSDQIAQVQARGNTYTLHRIKDNIHVSARELLVLTNASGVCSVLNDEEDGAIFPLSRYTTDDVAIALNYQKADQMIASAGGKQKFQQMLSDELKTVEKSVLYMPSDIYASLKAHGIDIPSSYQPFDSPPSYEELELERH